MPGNKKSGIRVNILVKSASPQGGNKSNLNKNRTGIQFEKNSNKVVMYL